jgi:hypothetical protein
MINIFVRILKRIAVLLPGLVIAYWAIRNLFPWFDQRLPLAFAVLVTYVLTAYLLIPAAIRVIRIFVRTNHLPLYCVTPDGFASDPLNIGLIGSREQLIEAMTAAGWYVADAHTLKNVARFVVSTLLKRPYPNAPMSNLYLFGRKQDIGFEIPLQGSGHRHHVRFWATTYKDEEFFCVHSIDWYNRRQIVGNSHNKELLWVGAASRDVGLSFIRHNHQISHMIAPDTDAERNLIADQLVKNQTAKPFNTIRLGQAYQVMNRVWRGYLHTDGRMRILRLKKKTKNKKN